MPAPFEPKTGIDYLPASNGNYKYQIGWAEFYNEQKGEANGKRLITAPDVYRACKEAPNDLLASIRRDFKASWLVTGTRIIYNQNDLSGKVIHNYKSTIPNVKPVEIALSEISDFTRAPIQEALEKGALPFLQALFMTKDDGKQIMASLEKLSRAMSSRIQVWTPSQIGRRDYPERAVGFFYLNNYFHVDVDWNDYHHGRARGVQMVLETKRR
jgi:hypothetical protein